MIESLIVYKCRFSDCGREFDITIVYTAIIVHYADDTTRVARNCILKVKEV